MNEIHSTVIIDSRVSLGTGNKILPYTILQGPLEIGCDNIIGPHVVIGSPGQDTRNPRYDSSNKKIFIGSNNIIREFTAIQKPVYEDITSLGSNIYLMQSVHIPHDAILEDNVVITPMASIAGIVRLLEGCNVGLGVQIHQRSVVGQFAIVGMGATVLKNVKPFSRFVPRSPLSVNIYAIQKFGFTEYTDEISKYVLEKIEPHSEKLLSIIHHYRDYHKLSGRQEY